MSASVAIFFHARAHARKMSATNRYYSRANGLEKKREKKEKKKKKRNQTNELRFFKLANPHASRGIMRALTPTVMD